MNKFYTNKSKTIIVMHDVDSNTIEQLIPIGGYESPKDLIQPQRIEIDGKPAKVNIEKITIKKVKVGGSKEIKRKTCSNCGEQGHLSKTCKVNASKEEGGQDMVDRTPYKKTVTEEDIAKIQEMRVDGYKSHQVAEELHIHLEVVNKHWNPLV